MLPALPSLASFLRALGILKTVASVKESFFGSSTSTNRNQSTKRTPTKGYKTDRTVFTEYHKHIIRSEYIINQHSHKCKKITLDELAEKLNRVLGLNKSRQSYSKIWNQKD